MKGLGSGGGGGGGPNLTPSRTHHNKPFNFNRSPSYRKFIQQANNYQDLLHEGVGGGGGVIVEEDSQNYIINGEDADMGGID